MKLYRYSAILWLFCGSLLACQTPSAAPVDPESAVDPSDGQASVQATGQEQPAETQPADTANELNDEAPDFEARAEAIEGDVQGQRQLAALFQEALRADNPRQVEFALHALGRRLGEFRPDGLDEALAEALRHLASEQFVALRQRVDGRYAIPAGEALLDLREAHSLRALATSFANGPAGERFERMAQAAERATP